MTMTREEMIEYFRKCSREMIERLKRHCSTQEGKEECDG